jgi:hydroxyacylglutathione hydrolase
MFASLSRLADLPETTRLYCAHEYTAMNLPFAAVVEPNNQAIKERIVRVRARREAGVPTVPLSLPEEKSTNPFLRCNEPAVISSALAKGATDASPVAVFAALRAWRNNF